MENPLIYYLLICSGFHTQHGLETALVFCTQSKTDSFTTFQYTHPPTIPALSHSSTTSFCKALTILFNFWFSFFNIFILFLAAFSVFFSSKYRVYILSDSLQGIKLQGQTFVSLNYHKQILFLGIKRVKKSDKKSFGRELEKSSDEALERGFGGKLERGSGGALERSFGGRLERSFGEKVKFATSQNYLLGYGVIESTQFLYCLLDCGVSGTKFQHYLKVSCDAD